VDVATVHAHDLRPSPVSEQVCVSVFPQFLHSLENKVMKLAVGSEKILIFGQCGPEKLIWPGH